MKAYLVALFGIAALLLMGVAVTNIAQDVDGHLTGRHSTEERMARALADGKVIAMQGDYNDRYLHHYLIRNRARTPEVIAMGSSRSMKISSQAFPGKRFFNHSVTSSKLVDYIGLVATYAHGGNLPGTIVIGVDPWVFNRNATVRPQTRIFAEEIQYFLASSPHPQIEQVLPSFPWRFHDLFSIKLAMDGYRHRSGMKSDVACGWLDIRDDERTVCNLRRPDGSVRFATSVDEMPYAERLESIRQALSAQKRMYQFNGYDRLDPAYQAAFVSFLQVLKSRNLQPVLFLSPYHPLVQAYYSDLLDWRLTMEAEAFVRKIGAQLNIPVVGSYSAMTAGCAAHEFTDPIHPTSECVSRIFSRLGTIQERLLQDRERNSS